MKELMLILFISMLSFNCIGQKEINNQYMFSSPQRGVGIGYAHYISDKFSVGINYGFEQWKSKKGVSDITRELKTHKLFIIPKWHFSPLGIEKNFIASAIGCYGSIAQTSAVFKSNILGNGNETDIDYETGVFLTFVRVNVFKQKLFFEINGTQGYKFTSLEFIKLDKPNAYAYTKANTEWIRRLFLGIVYKW